jgi:isoprenylcysteine carboxyl methyltransferase (ICMT) family protein YpbQ
MTRLPPSAVRVWCPWVGVAALLALLWALRGAALGTPAIMALLLAAYAVPVLLLDLASQRRSPAAASGQRQFGPRLAAQMATFAIIALACWLFPYTRTQWLFPVWGTLGALALPLLLGLLLLTTLYVALTRAEADDAGVHVGQMWLGRRAFAWDALSKNYCLGWLVKAFFLPLMAMFMAKDIAWFKMVDWPGITVSFPSLYDFLQRFIYFLDVTIALSGYLLTFRFAGTHIRSAEPTTFGWLVCLVCYPPFWAGFYDNFFAYESNPWTRWLWDGASWLHIGWGSLILMLGFVYVWATIAFGVRFSNLTHRGIITSGPYRFTKHPAYIAKNLSWWMISVPFLQSSGVADALRLSLLLLCVNLIYYARAKTEERHLGRDLVYRDYAAWISQHGLFARLKF